MTRLTDWPELLDVAIEAARHRPFAWGRQDCVTFAADCIWAVTGVDPLAGLGRWADRHQAWAVIRGAGCGQQSLQAAISRIMAAHGWPTIDPGQAGRGDLCLVDGGKGRFAAICLGARLAAPGPKALAFVPTRRALAAWRIG